MAGDNSLPKRIEPASNASADLLRQIIDAVPVGISYFDSSQRFCFANRNYEKLTGHSPNHLIGKTLEEANVEVSRAIGSCLTLVKERAKDAGVEIAHDTPSSLPALYADERKFKQILINLLSNAIKFTPSGGMITTRIWYHLDDGYLLQVADTGIGIALADIPKALSPFQQVDSDLNRKYDGTGLGLPLTKALAELHGGSLDLQSEVGVGTRVTVRFPGERVVAEIVGMFVAEDMRVGAE